MGKPIVVQLKMDPASKKLTTDPHPVVVDPDDTVTWRCDLGDVIVSFEANTPFVGDPHFHGKKGEPTRPAATVRADVPRGHRFVCTVHINGVEMKEVYGVDTSGI